MNRTERMNELKTELNSVYGINAAALDSVTDNFPDHIKKLQEQKLSLKDSGVRMEFDSGAMREITDEKGRCDLLPLDVVYELLPHNHDILLKIHDFKKDKDPSHLVSAITVFSNYYYGSPDTFGTYTAMLEVSKQYAEGAKKYSDNNWMKGIPLHHFIDSAVRHYIKFVRGDTDEPHDRAFIWNLIGAIWTIKHKPELDDIEKDLVDDSHK